MTKPRRFDSEDLRLLTDLGTFAASAYQAVLSLNAMQGVAAVVDLPMMPSSPKISMGSLPVGIGEP